MASELALTRADGSSSGSFNDVPLVIREIATVVQFSWTQSGSEKFRTATEQGIELPPPMRESLKTLPTPLEGWAELDGGVSFHLDDRKPVSCLRVTPRGDSPAIQHTLSALETKADGAFVFSGGETD